MYVTNSGTTAGAWIIDAKTNVARDGDRIVEGEELGRGKQISYTA